ncbi:TFIIA-alpha and beta-like factor, partial [Acanthisitta chloris]
ELYKSVMQEVIEGVRILFAEDGVEEHVLKDLKQLWETKVIQSKATEGYFRHRPYPPLFTLQPAHSFPGVLQASAASCLIPAGRDFQNFAAAELVCICSAATLALPLDVAYPIHVPAGVMLQTTSGQLYKVNVPVMVTQASEDKGILHHPVWQISHPLGQPSVLQDSVAQVNASSAQTAGDTLQQAMAFEPNIVEKTHLNSSATLVQQPSVSQQELATNAVLNQCAGSTEKSQHNNLHTAVFAPESSEGLFLNESLANNSSSVLLDAEGQLEPQEHQVSDIIDLIIAGESLDDNAFLKDQGSIASSGKPTEQTESNLQSEKNICSDIEGMIQLGGTGPDSPKEEIPHTKDQEENELICLIESEDLKVLDDEKDDGEECDNTSDTDSNRSGGDNEELQVDTVEEELLNSDDVREQDIPDLFEPANVIICQYEK